MKVILLNGPPRCGKDSAGEAIENLIPNITVRVDKFARVLKDRAHALYGMPNLRHDHFENKKDEPQECFLGLTPRQAYIEVSEQYFKPVHGADIFGKLFIEEQKGLFHTDILAITDCGFEAEVKALIDWVGADNVMLLNILRPGCTFDGDSRGYLNGQDVGSCDVIANNGTLEEFQKTVARVVADFALAPAFGDGEKL